MSKRLEKKLKHERAQHAIYGVVFASVVEALDKVDQGVMSLNDVWYRTKKVFMHGGHKKRLCKREFKATRIHEFFKMVRS